MKLSFSTNSNGSSICLISRASIEESWDCLKKLSHLNFNSINELLKKNLSKGLFKSIFTLYGLCDSCQKEKPRKTSCKIKTESSILESFHLLHIDLFRPVNIMYIVRKRYALVIDDKYTKYTWVYFLHKKDKAASILVGHVKQLDKGSKHTAKNLRSDNDI